MNEAINAGRMLDLAQYHKLPVSQLRGRFGMTQLITISRQHNDVQIRCLEEELDPKWRRKPSSMSKNALRRHCADLAYELGVPINRRQDRMAIEDAIIRKNIKMLLDCMDELIKIFKEHHPVLSRGRVRRALPKSELHPILERKYSLDVYIEWLAHHVEAFHESGK